MVPSTGLVLNAEQMQNGTLKFISEDEMVNELLLGRYVLGELGDRLKDRTRLTFRWKGQEVTMATIHTFQGAASPGLSNAAIQSLRATEASEAKAADPLGASSRLAQLLIKMEKLLAERYAFDVFAKNSINFGIMVTYRQTWEPQQYQVGDLVSTIPLAPKEVRRYTTRAVTKKTRADEGARGQPPDAQDRVQPTPRARTSEIVKKAQEKTHFNISASETFGGDGMSHQRHAERRRRLAARTRRRPRRSSARAC